MKSIFKSILVIMLFLSTAHIAGQETRLLRQPTINGNKPNVLLMYNPLKASGDLKLWTIGNLVGSDFTLGLGLSLKIGK